MCPDNLNSPPHTIERLPMPLVVERQNTLVSLYYIVVQRFLHIYQYLLSN